MAENRGKTLYCGIDQSDTFTKAETWAAGKDRNERDDTIYSGERGIFRGFIAAQEGWLTEGESGITGVSIDRIFEFPKEERRRVKRTKRISIGSVSNPALVASCQPAGDLLCSGEYTDTTGYSGNSNIAREASQRNARAGYYGDQTVHSGNHDWRTTPDPFDTNWQELAETAAAGACAARGYRLSRAAIGPGHDNNKATALGSWSQGDNLGWFYRNTVSGSQKYAARQSRTWTATCKKTVRRTRR